MADKWVLHSDAFKALLLEPKVQADLLRRAQAIAGAAGPGMEVEVENSTSRSRVSIHTATLAARLAEAKHRALTRAIDAGR